MPAGVHLFVTIFTVQCLKVPDEGLKKGMIEMHLIELLKLQKQLTDKSFLTCLLILCNNC